jgi:hypothetical protein
MLNAAPRTVGQLDQFSIAIVLRNNVTVHHGLTWERLGDSFDPVYPVFSTVRKL